MSENINDVWVCQVFDPVHKDEVYFFRSTHAVLESVDITWSKIRDTIDVDVKPGVIKVHEKESRALRVHAYRLNIGMIRTHADHF